MSCKTYHYYYAPYFGKYNGTNFCHFFMTYWEQGSPSLTPLGTFWKPVFLPRPGYVYDQYYDENFHVDDHIFSAMMMYRFFHNTTCYPLKTVIKVHDAKSFNGKTPETLREMMDLLTRIFDYDAGHEKAYFKGYSLKSRDLPMIPSLKKTEGYKAIRLFTNEEFQFLLNVVYDSQLPQKILVMDNPDSQSNIWVKYANTATKTHIYRANYTWQAAEKKVKDYYYNKEKAQVPYGFTSFMKHDLYF